MILLRPEMIYKFAQPFIQKQHLKHLSHSSHDFRCQGSGSDRLKDLRYVGWPGSLRLVQNFFFF